jgi:hypothetical protein
VALVFEKWRWLIWAMVAPAVLIFAVFTIVGFVEARSRELPAGFELYVHRADGTTADPINLVFRGTNSDGVAAAIARVMRWRFIVGSPMTFGDQGTDRPTAWQLGVDLGGGSRFHIRIESALPTDSPDFVLAAAHRDDSVPCGHVGRAFDETRDLIAQTFAAAGYRVTQLKLSNTQLGKHCDGSETAGDGLAVMIDLDGP